MTWVFWILVVLMVVTALAVILRPIFKARAGAARSAREQRLSAYRAQLAEIERDVASGELDAEQAAVAGQELGREMLHALENEPVEAAGMQKGRRWILPALIAIVLPVFALLLYLHVGEPGAVAVPGGSDAANAHPTDTASVMQMVARLEQRMQQDPENQQGWLMLGRSYMALGRYDDAVRAFKRLYALTGDEPLVLVHYADALAMASGGNMQGEPGRLVKKAVELDPDNHNGLWLAGMAAEEEGDHAGAVAYWERLMPLLSEDEKSRMEVAALIKGARGRMAPGEEVPASESTPENTPAGGASIRVHVDVAPELRARMDPQATVFVLAKAVEGPPMPLAVVRRAAAELPFEVMLDDSEAMAPVARLSNFDRVDVFARVSRSGQAERQSGDLMGEAKGIDVTNTGEVSITIDTQIP